MEDLMKEQKKLAGRASYKSSISEIDNLLAQLAAARDAIAEKPSSAPSHLVRLNQSSKKAFDTMNTNLKEVNSGLKSYSKVLDRTCKQPLEESDVDPFGSKTYLVNRAIAMHLLREGQFNVAKTFIKETQDKGFDVGSRKASAEVGERDWESRSEDLQKRFGEMYFILDEMKNKHNLSPAIDWARENSAVLDSRGSNLEFELCRLRFVSIFTTGTDGDEDEDFSDNDDYDAMQESYYTDPALRVMQATEYARTNFSSFHPRYSREVFQLLGAVAYWQNIDSSPYRPLFATDSSAWDDVAGSFTREFCALLGLSANSPLYIAATAGAIALPVLAKVKTLMKAKRTEWTTEEELPVEIPLPPSYSFHSIFVCPVSKEQATDANPPMMLPCGHVLAHESLKNASKMARFKCPYCPVESHPKDAKKVYL
jgi:E3 ubiquitin-protein transferase RMND5